MEAYAVPVDAAVSGATEQTGAQPTIVPKNSFARKLDEARTGVSSGRSPSAPVQGSRVAEKSTHGTGRSRNFSPSGRNETTGPATKKSRISGKSRVPGESSDPKAVSADGSASVALIVPRTGAPRVPEGTFPKEGTPTRGAGKDVGKAAGSAGGMHPDIRGADLVAPVERKTPLGGDSWRIFSPMVKPEPVHGGKAPPAARAEKSEEKIPGGKAVPENREPGFSQRIEGEDLLFPGVDRSVKRSAGEHPVQGVGAMASTPGEKAVVPFVRTGYRPGMPARSESGGSRRDGDHGKVDEWNSHQDTRVVQNPVGKRPIAGRHLFPLKPSVPGKEGKAGVRNGPMKRPMHAWSKGGQTAPMDSRVLSGVLKDRTGTNGMQPIPSGADSASHPGLSFPEKSAFFPMDHGQSAFSGNKVSLSPGSVMPPPVPDHGSTNAQGVLNQVLSQLHVMTRPGTGEKTLSLQLHPESLGRLKMRVSLQGHHLVADLTAVTPHAKELIAGHMHTLRQALTDQGFHVERFDVHLRNDAGGNAFANTGQTFRDPGGSGREGFTYRGLSGMDEPEAISLDAAIAVSEHGVNLFA